MSKEKVEKLRKENNEYVLSLLRDGHPCSTITMEMSWWPPRPLIVKNKDDIKKVYRMNEDDDGRIDGRK